MKTRLSTALAVALLLPLSSAARGPGEPPPVGRNSDAIRAVLAQPITSEPLPLLIAREKLRFAKDEQAAKSIDLYLTMIAVRQVFGEAIEPKGTIADIVEDRVGSPPMNSLVRRLLDSTLRAEVAAEPLRHNPSSGLIEVPINIRNVAARRVTEQEFKLKVGPREGPAMELRCDGSGSDVPIDSNAAAPRVCTTNSRVIPREQLEGALKAPGWIRLSVTRLQFDDPNLSVNTERAIWFDHFGSQAYEKAREDLAALGCKERGTCFREAMPALESNPAVWFAAVFAGAGLVAGTIIALFTRRRWRWGWSLAGVVAGAIVATIAGLLMANSLVGLVILVVAPAAFGGFLAGLLPALALVKGRHPG
jgi:hypothetical protein